MRTDVLGVGFDNVTLDEAVDRALALLEEDGPHLAATPNPEIVQCAGRDPEFAGILSRADLVLPDGVGVIHAANILGRPLRARVPGIDFASALMGRIAGTGKRLYLLGAAPGVAEQAAANLQAAYPGLVVCGTHDGYFKEDGPVIDAIRKAGADLVFVCLGAPKQEKWIAAHGAAAGARLPVGALQSFLDDWLMDHPGRVDYIHGEAVAREFAARSGNIAFLLPPMAKQALFPSVIHDGVLPRKTFSMGEAHDKRFYLEGRKIR